MPEQAGSKQDDSRDPNSNAGRFGAAGAAGEAAPAALPSWRSGLERKPAGQRSSRTVSSTGMTSHSRAPVDMQLRPTLHEVVRRANLGVALIAVITAALALAIAGSFALRVYADHNLNLIARAMSYTVESAVAFNDPKAALDSLALIGSTEDVAEAELSGPDGRLLALWRAPSDGSWSQAQHIVASLLMPSPVILPIIHEGHEVGRVSVRGSGGAILQFLLCGVLAVLACLCLSVVAAIYLSRRMQSDIVAPLQALAKVAHAVHLDRTTGQRVPPAAIAELNELGNDFNALLEVLEAWQRQTQRENAFLAHQASHDSLTGLPNRAFFEARLGRAMTDAAEMGSGVAVLFLDSDRFKEINDRMGHAAGDAVLVSVASRVRGQLRDGDLVARIGGDEFAVLLAPLHSMDDATRIADKIIGAMIQPIPLPGGEEVVSSVSIGIAVFPQHADQAHELLAAADRAMYRAKRIHRGGREVAGMDDLEVAIRP
jgi:diguanylate cyclase (GGDEF)-like protein